MYYYVVGCSVLECAVQMQCHAATILLNCKKYLNKMSLFVVHTRRETRHSDIIIYGKFNKIIVFHKNRMNTVLLAFSGTWYPYGTAKTYMR